MRYELASNGLSRSAQSPVQHPCRVALAIVDGVWRVEVSEGLAFGGAGATLSVDEALQPKWRSFFARAEGDWLLPVLRRVASGEKIEMQELIDHYVDLHGEEPSSRIIR